MRVHRKVIRVIKDVENMLTHRIFKKKIYFSRIEKIMRMHIQSFVSALDPEFLGNSFATSLEFVSNEIPQPGTGIFDTMSH